VTCAWFEKLPANRFEHSGDFVRITTDEVAEFARHIAAMTAASPQASGTSAEPSQSFRDGYTLGFSAAKHPFHMPTVQQAWTNRDDIRARGHLPPIQASSGTSAAGEATPSPAGGQGELLERIDRAIERETLNLPLKASSVTIETLRQCRAALSTDPTIATAWEAGEVTQEERDEEARAYGIRHRGERDAFDEMQQIKSGEWDQAIIARRARRVRAAIAGTADQGDK
jgi:hypothetical protein